MDAAVTGVKRAGAGLDDGGARKEPRGADSEAGAAASAGAAPRANAGAAKQEAFNEMALRFYYKYLFPYNQMFRWLSYGNDPDSANPKVKRDYFMKREFTFTMADDVYIRYLSFRDEAELHKAVNARQPEKIDIGPVYNVSPDQHLKLKGGDRFRAEERELIFDIDLTDYDDIRTCCTGANICKRCWAYMGAAVRFLDGVLRTAFGFANIMFVYSGRRGVHCWVCDDEARKLTDEARGAVVSYISVLASAAGGGGGDFGGGGAGAGGDGGATGKGHTVGKVITALTVPLHPVFSTAFRDLEAVFESAVIPAAGQGLLATAGQWNKLLDQLPDFPTDNGDTTLKQLLAAEWAKASNTPEQRWRQLRDSVRRLIDLAGGSLSKGFGGGGGAGGKGRGKSAVKMTTRQRMDLERLVPAIVFTYTFPRLDVEVSKHRNHLLKAPFCVHPKTGRVCVPINPAAADAFDPTTVPTVARLQEEGTEWAKRTGRGAFAPQRSAGGAGAGAGGGNDDGDDTMSEASSTTAGGSSSASATTASASAKARGDMDGMVEATSLRAHVRAFEAFVKTCEAETWRAIRASDAAAAAYTGEW